MEKLIKSVWKKKRSKFRLTLSVLALGVLVLAMGVGVGWAATTIYVDGTNGDDNNNGQTLEEAVKTISKGVELVDPGGTVNVAAGSYNEGITIDKSLTLQGENRETTIIDQIVTINGSDVTFTGFTVNGIYLSSSSSSNTLTDNTCSSDSEDGIYLNSSSGNTLTGNTCSSNGKNGIFLNSSSNNNTLTNNTCSSNGENGISLNSSSSNILTGNTCSSNGENGIFLNSSSSNILTNNTCEKDIFLNSSPCNIFVFDPLDDATGVALDANLAITFSENMVARTGNIVIHKSDDTEFESIPVEDTSRVSIANEVVTIDPTGTFESQTGYYVQIAATCFDDTSGNSYAGIDDKTTWNFTSADVEDPTVTSVTLDTTSPVKAEDVTVTIDFSKAMDTGVTPTVSFGVSDPYSDVTLSGGSWTDSDTFTITMTSANIEAGTDGTNHFKISGAEDLAGNVMDADTSNTFVVDTTKPGVSSVEVSPDPAEAGTVTLTVNFDESMEQSVAPTVTFGIPSPYNTRTVTGSWQSATQWEGTATVDDTDEGTNTVKISGAQDLATNVMDNDTSKTFVVDTTAPTSPTISIDEGDYTNTTSINLTLSAVDATEMYISGDITGTPSWIAYATSASVTLTTGDGSKTVSVKYRDVAGNETSPVSDAITLDTTNPTVIITDPSEDKSVSSASYTIKGTANDPGSSGLAKVEVSIDDGSTWNDAAGTSSWTYAATLASGANIIKARSTDNAGNLSDVTTGVTLTMAGSSSTIELGTSKLNIPANGSSTSTITAVVSDEDGNPVADGTEVSFATTLGAITTSSTTTDGEAKVTLTSGTTSGTAAVKATVNGVSSTIYITFTSGASSVITIGLTADPKSIVANGSSTSTITAVVSDEDGNPMADETEVSFTTTLGTITTSSTTTNGVAKATLTSGASSGTATISVSTKGVSDTTQVDITADVVEEEVTETISEGEADYLVEGSAESDTTVTVTTTAEVEVTITNYTDNPHPEAASPMDSLNKHCDISVSNPDAISWPIRVEVSYTDDEIAAKGLIEESLKLYYFKDGAWHECSDAGVDTINNIVWAEMTREEASGSPVDAKGSYHTTQYTLTLNSTTGGSVTTPGEGAYTYDAGTVVSISATPDSDYNFVNWTGDVETVADVNAASTTITMNGNYTVTANFTTKGKLEITKVANYVSGSDPPLVSAITTYDLVIGVKNVGDSAAKSVVVKDALPSGVTYKSSSVSQGSLTLTGSSITWSVGRLTGEADATATVTVTVKPTAADAGNRITLNNGATGTGTDESSGISVSDGLTSPTVTLPVAQVILTIVKDGPAVADAGSTITYSITYGNTGTGDATSVVISDVVPEDTTFVSATGGGTYDSATNTVTWHIELISADTIGLAVSFDVKIDTDLPPGTTVITNQTSIASYYGTELTDEALSNEVNTTVVVSFLEIDKSVDVSTAVTGDIITYTVKLTNISTHDEALDIEISDKLPFGIVYISNSTSINGVLASDPSGSNPFSWPIDAIGPESTATITYKCAIGLNAVAGFHDNEATIKSYSVDGITLVLDSPRAMARVKIVVFETKGIIIGKVFEDLNGDGWQDKGEPGIPGIDIVMEDGTTVTTDVDGKYSIPGVEPGYHVLTIDEATLPEGYEILGEVSNFVEVPEVGMAKLNSTVVKQQEGEAKRDPG